MVTTVAGPTGAGDPEHHGRVQASPPEDVEPGGYAASLEALGDPAHEEHENWTDWIGGSFDSDEFDLPATNAGLKHFLPGIPYGTRRVLVSSTYCLHCPVSQ